MIRITENRTAEGVTLKLEGKLLAAWVDEFLTACSSVASCGAVRLDLHDLTFVDAQGAAALRRVRREGVTLGACSNFVSQVLEDLSHA